MDFGNTVAHRARENLSIFKTNAAAEPKLSANFTSNTLAWGRGKQAGSIAIFLVNYTSRLRPKTLTFKTGEAAYFEVCLGRP